MCNYDLQLKLGEASVERNFSVTSFACYIIHLKEKKTAEAINRQTPFGGITHFLHNFKLDEKAWVHLNPGPSAPEFPD